MSDLGYAEFYDRIARIERARAKGLGFEAVGTLGRSHFSRKSRAFRLDLSFLRPVIALIVCCTVVKAMFLHQLGAEAYGDRIEKMMTGDSFDRVGAWFMQADPMTTTLSNQISMLLRRVN